MNDNEVDYNGGWILVVLFTLWTIHHYVVTFSESLLWPFKCDRYRMIAYFNCGRQNEHVFCRWQTWKIILMDSSSDAFY